MSSRSKQRHFLNRRKLLQFGFGAAAFLGSPALAQIDRNCQMQQLDSSFSSSTFNQSLKQLAASKQLIYGGATDHRILLNDPDFASSWTTECGILAPENDLKWKTLRPHPDEFDFTAGDWLLSFAQTHNLLMRGHTLVWHSALPDWFEETVNRQNAERFFINHIDVVSRHYAGKIHSWDVVNEAIDPSDDRSDQLRTTPWLNLLGTEYIDLAFRVAFEADPHALLTYNDYGIEYDTLQHDCKRAAVLKLLEKLKAQGTPIHAFGMQSHLFASETRFNPNKLRQFLTDVASLGLKILVTELDVADRYLPADIAVRDYMVAAAYEDYLNVVLDEPAVIAVVTWGLSDRYTWLAESQLRQDRLPVRPLPLDDKMNRKLAWHAIARSFDTLMAPPLLEDV